MNTHPFTRLIGSIEPDAVNVRNAKTTHLRCLDLTDGQGGSIALACRALMVLNETFSHGQSAPMFPGRW